MNLRHIALASIALPVAVPAQSARDCHLELGTPIRVMQANGARIYIEPETSAPTKSGLVVLGSPTFVWTKPTSDSNNIVIERGLGVMQDHWAGAYVDSHGTAVPIPLPPGNGKMFSPVMAPAQAGGWHVVWSDFESRNRTIGTDSARLRYGRLTDGGWRDTASIGLRPGMQWVREQRSNLLVVGDELWVAASGMGAGSVFDRFVTVLHRASDGSWHAEDIADRNGTISPRLSLDEGRLTMYFVGVPDDLVGNSGGAILSRTLDLRTGKWSARRTLFAGSDDHILAFHMAATRAGEARELLWFRTLAGTRRRLLFAMDLVSRSPMVLDSNASTTVATELDATWGRQVVALTERFYERDDRVLHELGPRLRATTIARPAALTGSIIEQWWSRPAVAFWAENVSQKVSNGPLSRITRVEESCSR
ncbi:MAG: hypothetical protein JWO05_1889 [Gemmatimonadetes bacterium]|nr:hypothetical protein [Gemmatimonadota bacterium]